MKTTRALLLMAAIAGSSIYGLPVMAQSSSPPARAGTEIDANLNSIDSFNVADDGGTLYVRLTMKSPLKAKPASFTVANPPRIAFDFPGTANGLGRGVQSIERGDLRSANVVQVGDRTRLVLNMARLLPYETRVDGNVLTVALSAGSNAPAVAARPVASPPGASPAVATTTATAAKPAATTQATAPAASGQSVNDINFRRGGKGEGRIVVQLSSADIGTDVRQQGGKLVVSFVKAKLPDHLRRRSDVTDFGTPVTQLLAEQQGENVRLTITPTGLWEHNAYQSNDQFVLEVKRMTEDPNRLVQRGGGRVKYAGEKLSLNFQNVDVRSVLQVIADFTDFNIVTSDSVQGNLTLRLKDVPWDQALDIILQAKGLDMRRNGNVIWIAPGDELAAREKMINEARAQVEELEPLQTESFQINYHRATEITTFLQAKGQTVLSKRGSVVVDDRSNKIFVTDIGARLTDVRRVVAEIDIAPKQVLIEARIVEATKGFARELGVKLGYGDSKKKGLGNGAQVGFGHGNFSERAPTIENPSTITEAKPGDAYNAIDHFWQGAQGAPVWSGTDLANPMGALGLTLVNKSLSRFLNIELQAQEHDGKTRIISSPRVLTANNVEATIEDGTEVPYQEASTAGNTSVSFKKAVLSLKVKPQITPDGRLQLAINVNKDSVGDVFAGVPSIDTKNVKSDVLIDNGGTVVIGGIYTDKEQNTVDKVPLLGDIPVIGHLFRSTAKEKKETELLIFITPRIVDEALTLR